MVRKTVLPLLFRPCSTFHTDRRKVRVEPGGGPPRKTTSGSFTSRDSDSKPLFQTAGEILELYIALLPEFGQVHQSVHIGILQPNNRE